MYKERIINKNNILASVFVKNFVSFVKGKVKIVDPLKIMNYGALEI